MSDIRTEYGEREMHLDLPAAHSAGRMARRMVAEFAASEGIPESELATLEFVAGELIDNAVDHGGGGGAREVADLARDVRMQLWIRLEGKAWSVLVEDCGGGNLEQLRSMVSPPDGIPDLDDDRGRGFFLLGQMVDRLEVDSSRDGLGLGFCAVRSYDGDAPAA
ncbi:MAG: anti-sigma regulatory factor (Ser/Thr protein kinase) [Planctomycetota bacterium]|jgi:anti-sigma regulatory factor (Ser/Thr protein kinase)